MIISLDLLQRKYHTTFDSEKKNAFKVEVSDAVTITFEGFGSNLNTPVTKQGARSTPTMSSKAKG